MMRNPNPMDSSGRPKTNFKTLICLRPYPVEKRINIPGFTGSSDPAIGLAVRKSRQLWQNHRETQGYRIIEESERTMREIVRMRPKVDQAQALDARVWIEYSKDSFFQGVK
jgi:hypothetical protein